MNGTRDPGAEDSGRSSLSPEQHNLEVVKLYFEFFKHFTTISTAAALVELALYQQLQLDSTVAVVGVMTSGFTLLLSIIGMASLPLWLWRYVTIQKASPALGAIYPMLLSLLAIVFVSGVFLFVIAALNPDPAILWLGPPVLIGMLLVQFGWFAFVLSRPSQGSSNGDDVQSERRDT